MDLSVKESEGPSGGWRVGVNERVCRSLSDPSLVCVRADEGRMSAGLGRPGAIPAQSPDMGRVGYVRETMIMV